MTTSLKILGACLTLAACSAPAVGAASAKKTQTDGFLPRQIPREFKKGVSEARKALKSGRLAYESIGALLIWDSEYEEVLAKYGVERRIRAFCTPSDEDLEMTRGFNSIMMPAIERRHGKKFFRRAMIEAIVLWRERNPGKSDGVNLEELAKS